jgi:hypothetical protein
MQNLDFKNGTKVERVPFGKRKESRRKGKGRQEKVMGR